MITNQFQSRQKKKSHHSRSKGSTKKVAPESEETQAGPSGAEIQKSLAEYVDRNNIEQVLQYARKIRPFTPSTYATLKARIAQRLADDEFKRQNRTAEDTFLKDGEIVVGNSGSGLAIDPNLVEGKTLPPEISPHFPFEHVGIPVEDFDPYHREYEETFLIISRRFNKFGFIYRMTATKALGIFSPWNPIRRLALYIYTHSLFDIIVIFTILANSIYMAMNIEETVPEYTFLAIYTFEAILKAISRGLIWEKNTYLRDPWNWLDFVVLVTAYATIIAEFLSTGTSINVQALRTFRVFRVLKTVAVIPGLKRIIEALMRALRMLGDVYLITFLFFTIAALFGTEIFMGSLRTKCVRDASSFGIYFEGNSTDTDWSKWVTNSSNWNYRDDGLDYEVCANISGAQHCPINYTCLRVDSSPNPQYDFTSFDNFYRSFLISIQLFNTDYWDYLYTSVISGNGYGAFVWFVLCIVLLSYYLANLFQAVVTLSYQVEDDDDSRQYGNQKKGNSKRKLRFVFDPWKLRNVRTTRVHSLTSIKEITEQHLNKTLPADLKIPQSSSLKEDSVSDNMNSSKPIAVVKPTAIRASNSAQSDAKDSWWKAFINHRYRAQSRPPSGVDKKDVSKVGYWDRNPLCCFKCCICYFPWLRAQHYLLIFVTDPFFDLLITFAIVINTASMAANYHGISKELTEILKYTNEVCTYIFIIECLLKIMAMCGDYFKNPWNFLDFAIVIGSLVDIFFTFSDLSDLAGFNTSIIRLLRLLRILKLAKSWKTMRTLLEIIFSTVGAVGNLMLVLLIVIFIFAVIGMQLFSKSYEEHLFMPNVGKPSFTIFPGFFGIPEWNWTDFFHSFMMVFRVLCRETYQPMWDCITANSEAICVPVYLLILMIGSYVVLNLFMAVLLNAFSTDTLRSRTSEGEEEDRLKKRLKRVKIAVKHFLKRGCRRNKVSAENDDDTSRRDESYTYGTVTHGTDAETSRYPVKSVTEFGRLSQIGETESDSVNIQPIHLKDCCCRKLNRKFPKLNSYFSIGTHFGSWFHRSRLACLKVTEHKAFEYTILGFIFASSLSLCLQDATVVEHSTMDNVLGYLDFAYLAVFTVEMFIKIYALGFHTYFSSFWTLLDFFIVVTGYVDLIVTIFVTSSALTALRALRTLRALRPLRAISRWQGMKIVVNALIAAIPPIANVLLVVMMIWLIFAIMGVQFFAGKYWYCVDIKTGDRLPRGLVHNKEECLADPENRAWAAYIINFDHVGNAYLALLQVATFEGWTNVIQLAVDSADNLDEQPSPDNNIYYYIYFLFFIVICSFFLLNLFVGVIIDGFNALKKKYEGSSPLELFMTEQQTIYYRTIKRSSRMKPTKTVTKPTGSIGVLMYEIGNSSRFEAANTIAIAVNIFSMAISHFNQDVYFTFAQEMIDLTFTTIFTLEAIVLLIALRQSYFKNLWRIFDFIVVSLSIISYCISDILMNASVSPLVARSMRLLRIGRVLRLIRASKGVRKLMFSFVMSIPALFNISCLLFLIIFIYAIIGMNLFGHVGKFGGNLDDIANFQTFTNALLTLFRLTTVSGWDNIHQGLSFSDDSFLGCQRNVSLLAPDYVFQNPCCNRTAWARPNGEIVWTEDETGNCGNYTLASLFCVSYLLSSSFIIVNMFAAVILDNYQQAVEQDKTGVTDADIEMYYKVWGEYDPGATQFIPLNQLGIFVASLDPPFSCPRPNDQILTIMNIDILRDKKTDKDVVHCLDVLLALIRRALGLLEETEELSRVRQSLEDVFLKTFPTRAVVFRVSSTKERKKEEIAARTLQKTWRSHVMQKKLREATAQKEKGQQREKERQQDEENEKREQNGRKKKKRKKPNPIVNG